MVALAVHICHDCVHTLVQRAQLCEVHLTIVVERVETGKLRVGVEPCVVAVVYGDILLIHNFIPRRFVVYRRFLLFRISGGDVRLHRCICHCARVALPRRDALAHALEPKLLRTSIFAAIDTRRYCVRVGFELNLHPAGQHGAERGHYDRAPWDKTVYGGARITRIRGAGAASAARHRPG